MTEKPAIETGPSHRPSNVRGTNQSGMRARNEKLVLSLVRRHQALAKSELARMTGLSAQTVSVIMRQLENDGLLLRGEPLRGKVGQPSVPMRLNPDGAYFLGLKVGRRSSELVLTDFLGQVRNRTRATYDYPTPEATLDFAAYSMRNITAAMPEPERSRVAGLGVAIPFYLWDWAQILQVPKERMESWRSANLLARLSEVSEVPVYSENDATAACGAELVFGPADGPRDFLYFYVGYFIGGGVVLNGSIFSGRGNAGALGPMPVAVGSQSVRPLIDVASLYVLERTLWQTGRETSELWETPDHWNIPSDLLEGWLDSAAQGLAHAILSSCSLIDFECVKIDGWMPSDVRTKLVHRVTRHLSKLDLTGLERPEIIAGGVGPDARAIGAASLPLSDRYLIKT